MTATAYTAGHDGVGTRTATGTTVRKGVVAVDRKVIPLGTKMFIVANGGIVYGSAVAEDSGIRGNKVDLYHDTYNECIQFGRRGCTVYILEESFPLFMQLACCEFRSRPFPFLLKFFQQRR